MEERDTLGLRVITTSGTRPVRGPGVAFFARRCAAFGRPTGVLNLSFRAEGGWSGGVFDRREDGVLGPASGRADLERRLSRRGCGEAEGAPLEMLSLSNPSSGVLPLVEDKGGVCSCVFRDASLCAMDFQGDGGGMVWPSVALSKVTEALVLVCNGEADGRRVARGRDSDRTRDKGAPGENGGEGVVRSMTSREEIGRAHV